MTDIRHRVQLGTSSERKIAKHVCALPVWIDSAGSDRALKQCQKDSTCSPKNIQVNPRKGTEKYMGAIQVVIYHERHQGCGNCPVRALICYSQTKMRFI